jgi:hypothetical protein
MILEKVSAQIDTVVLSRKDAIRVLTRLENLKADSVELSLKKQELGELKTYSDQQKISIVNLQDKSRLQDLQIGNLNEQLSITTKALKKQKRKTILTTVAGIGVTASLVFLMVAFK